MSGEPCNLSGITAPVLGCCGQPLLNCLPWQFIAAGSQGGPYDPRGPDDGVTDALIQTALANASFSDPAFRFFDYQQYGLGPLRQGEGPAFTTGWVVASGPSQAPGGTHPTYTGAADATALFARVNYNFCPNIANVGAVGFNNFYGSPYSTTFWRRMMTKTRVWVQGDFCLFDVDFVSFVSNNAPGEGGGWRGPARNCRHVGWFQDRPFWYVMPRPERPEGMPWNEGVITFLDETCSCMRGEEWTHPSTNLAP